MQVLQVLKYYGDGLRWFNRFPVGYEGHAKAVVRVVQAFESKHGIINEVSSKEYMRLYE